MDRGWAGLQGGLKGTGPQQAQEAAAGLLPGPLTSVVAQGPVLRTSDLEFIALQSLS